MASKAASEVQKSERCSQQRLVTLRLDSGCRAKKILYAGS